MAVPPSSSVIEIIDLCHSDNDDDEEVKFISSRTSIAGPKKKKDNANHRIVESNENSNNSNSNSNTNYNTMGQDWSGPSLEATSSNRKRNVTSTSDTTTTTTSIGENKTDSSFHHFHYPSKRRNKEKNIASVPVCIDMDGPGGGDNGIITEGILELMEEQLLQQQHQQRLNYTMHATTASNKNKTYRLLGKYSTIRHIQQTDSWSCGFRNLQMILTALLPRLEPNHPYFQKMPRRSTCTCIPNVGQIQKALEQAWKEGYDPRGAAHYKYRIVHQTSQIGAMEVSSVLSYWGMDSTVIQFVTCQPSRILLTQFVQAYFSKAWKHKCCCNEQSRGGFKSDVLGEQLLQMASSTPSSFSTSSDDDDDIESCDCPLLPLYLQWEGHSITIVGTEQNENGTSWLVLDPMKDGAQLKDKIKKKTLPRFSPHKLKSTDTQIVLSTYCALSHPEQQSQREFLKVLTAAKDDVLRAVAAAKKHQRR
eukprot:scaffold1663_cov210-Cylindrotheca_fusiformis.AAC.4